MPCRMDFVFCGIGTGGVMGGKGSGKSTEPRKALVRWDDRFYVEAYALAQQGLPDNAIAAAIGVSATAFWKWAKSKPALAEALKRARTSTGPKGSGQFSAYVYKNLPPHLQQLWDRINLCDRTTSGYERMEHLFKEAGLRARQHLFLHAMIVTHFNWSEACRKVGISKATVDLWVRTDPDFPALVDEIHWHKKNFFESHLIERVAEGDVPSTIFANRTMNRDRGYGDTKQIEVTGEVRHTHSHLQVVIDPEKLGLSEEMTLALLEKLREHGLEKHRPLPDVLLDQYDEVLTDEELREAEYARQDQDDDG